MFRKFPAFAAVIGLALATLMLSGAPAQAEDVEAVVVPSVLGKQAEDARQKLEEQGLRVDMTYVEDDIAPPGTVVGQDPRSGSEVLKGTRITLRIIGPAPADVGPIDPDPIDPEDPTDPADPGATQVEMPDLTGLRMQDAEAAVMGLGLIPAVDFVPAESSDDIPFTVRSQNVPAGQIINSGDAVRMAVIRPPEELPQLLVPHVAGLREADAVQLLGQIGLSARIVRVYSNLPEGLVMHQEPTAGTEVDPGAEIEMRISKRPPPTWQPTTVNVPNLTGMPSDKARILLLTRGLLSRVRYETAAERPIRRVHRQSRAPGTPVPLGTRITIYIPRETTVPDLIDRTRAQANAALSAARLLAKGIGPVVGAPPSRVVSQSHPPGSRIARGSRVTYTYKFNEAPKTIVPQLVGLSRGQAINALAAKGLNAHAIGPNNGFGPTVVTQQFKAPGSLVLKGSTVSFKFKYKGLVPIKVKVPNLIGKTRNQALVLLGAKGLNANAQGPNVGLGQTQVIWQNPGSNTFVSPGSTVTFKYKFTGGIGPINPLVTMPNLIGKSKPQAQILLQSRGLNGVFQGPNFGIGTTQVIFQSRPAGSKVPKGTTIQVKYKWVGNVGPILPLVTVPQLVNKTTNQAVAALQARGLKWQLVGPQLGLGFKRVTSQSKAAGSKVPKGTTILVKYKFTGGVGPIQPIQVTVPQLIGKTRNQAKALLQARGLKWNFQGPQVGLGSTKVTAQSRPAGSQVIKGTTITAQYKFTGPVGPQLILRKVPNLVGKSVAQAKALLQARQLTWKFTGIGNKVKTQSVAPGTMVPKGTQVKMKRGL